MDNELLHWLEQALLNVEDAVWQARNGGEHYELLDGIYESTIEAMSYIRKAQELMY